MQSEGMSFESSSGHELYFQYEFSDYRSHALEALSSPQLVIRRMLQWVSKRKFVDGFV